MSEIGPRMLVNVLLDLLPRPTVRANFLAPSANWDHSAKSLEFLFVLRQQRPALPCHGRNRSWRLDYDHPDRHDRDGVGDKKRPSSDRSRRRQNAAYHNA